MPDEKSIKILLAEDAPSMRKIERSILASLGYENIVEAEDGALAIDILQEQDDFDLIISDWNMPNKGGYELLFWVRAYKRYKDIPFIMATAQADKAQAAKAFDAGVSGFVAKPFTPEELNAAIDQVLGRVNLTPATMATGPVMGASGKVKLRMAHIQITDHIILGVLKQKIAEGEFSPRHFELETICMGGWNPVLDALEKGAVDGAFLLAPLAQDLFSVGVPIKLVLLAHKRGSIFVRSTQGPFIAPWENFFRNKTVLIPHKMSVHHMLVHKFFAGIGLNASLNKGADVDVNLEVVAPVQMPQFMQENENVAGFMVAEPIGSKAVAAGIAERQFLSNELWEHHPCCTVVLREDFIGPYEEAVYELTDLLVKCGKFVEGNPERAAQIAVDFLDPTKKLGLKTPVIENVLKDPQGITTGDLFPVLQDFETMQHYMHEKMHAGTLVKVDELVDTRYAEAACESLVINTSVMHDNPEAVAELLARGGQAAFGGFVLKQAGDMIYFFQADAAGA